MKDELNRGVPIPLYYQLKEMIREQVEKGILKPGDSLPSERELSEKYGISRPTVRQAIKELVYEGLLEREKGRGTFVSQPKIDYSFIQHFTTFYDDMLKKGYTLKTKVLKKEVKEANRKISRLLQIEEGDKIIFIERLRSIRGEPIVDVQNHIPYHLCPGLVEDDLTDRSLYKLLAEKYGLRSQWADITLETIVAGEQESALLGIEKGSPMLLMENLTYDQNNRIMDFFRSRFRGDKGKVRVRVYRDEG